MCYRFSLVIFRYLASGAEQSSLALAFRVGVSTVNQILEEVCDAIWEELSDDFVKFPSSEEVRKQTHLHYHDNSNNISMNNRFKGELCPVLCPITKF